MYKIEQTIKDLNEALNKVNDVSIITMDAGDFEKLLAWNYGVLNNYEKERERNEKSLNILELAHQLLEKVLKRHISINLIASQKTVFIFHKTVELLLNIIAIDFRMNESTYKDARTTCMFLGALKASKINPPGHYTHKFNFSWLSTNTEDLFNKEALTFASAHIEEYSRFIFDLASNNTYIQDPFELEPTSRQLAIYSKIKSLTTSFTLLPSEQLSRNA